MLKNNLKMRFSTFSFLIFAVISISLCQGSRIIYPNDLPNLLEELGIDSKIDPRFTFPENEGPCSEVPGEKVDCLPLRQCPELREYIRERNSALSQEDISFLRGRICSRQRNSVSLCCVLTPPTSTQSPPANLTKETTPKPTEPEEDLIPTMDECGFVLVGNRITDGIEISHGTHPWLTGLGYPLEDQKAAFRVRCGGTLITKRHVISAAHCFVRRPGQRSLTHAILGEHSLSKDTERRPPLVLEIAQKINPGYNRISHVNDIELLTLERDVKFTTYIRPACLPFVIDRNRNFDNEQMTIVGWGDTFHRSLAGNDVPLAANISVIPKPECREDYKSEPQVPLDNTQFCVGKGTKDACQGDSGGPLLYRDLTKHFRIFLMGVVSFGVQCANPAFPGVYTYIPEFLTWITENL